MSKQLYLHISPAPGALPPEISSILGSNFAVRIGKGMRVAFDETAPCTEGEVIRVRADNALRVHPIREGYVLKDKSMWIPGAKVLVDWRRAVDAALHAHLARTSAKQGSVEEEADANAGREP